LYGFGCLLLITLFFFGSTIKGATSWFSFGSFSLQPVDGMKIILIIVLAKYLSRRHMEIARIKHLIISGLYFAVPFLLVLAQPDFGSSLILLAIWFGMVLVSGLSRRHLLVMTFLALIAGTILWFGVFKTYQKERILTFLHPAEDISGTGYNSYQSMVAVGSGRLFGKGVGYGTQARLQFLPEHETDFIFASFAEEWGFVGSILIYLLMIMILVRGIVIARHASSGFEALLALGIVFYLGTHVIINIGMNIGLLPITGVTLPFMSYGGSHIMAECVALGLLMSIERFGTRAAPVHEIQHEFLGYRS
jgi:rod shape determining protein RodA